MSYAARVSVMLKPGIADPQGQTIERALPALGYEGVENVRVGKVIELDVSASSESEARSRCWFVDSKGLDSIVKAKVYLEGRGCEMVNRADAAARPRHLASAGTRRTAAPHPGGTP